MPLIISLINVLIIYLIEYFFNFLIIILFIRYLINPLMISLINHFIN
jgi:hypothetical protein